MVPLCWWTLQDLAHWLAQHHDSLAGLTGQPSLSGRIEVGPHRTAGYTGGGVTASPCFDIVALG